VKIVIAVDANIILSALLGGKPSTILFDGRFQFVTAEFTVNEVKKYLPKLGKKLGISEVKLTSLLNELPIHIYSRSFYKNKIKAARKIIGRFDKKDVEILALAMQLDTFIWSQDKHFEKSGYQKVLKTYDFIG
jgi:predicted nucleic acid-binding protein